MFGMGFTEILIIAVIAVLFLGPDKLPSAMVDIAKFFRSAKDAIGSVKDTLEEEMHMSDIKKEALAYKAQLEDVKASVDIKAQLSSFDESLLSDGLSSIKKPEPKEIEPKEPEEVTFKKKKKKDSDVKDSDAEVEDV
jgi:sec-independent protein translocase protein TatB